MEIVHTDKAPAAIGPYSQAIVSGSFVFTAGQIALDPATMEVVASDVATQTERVLRNLAAVLQEAGSSLTKVVKTTVYLADMRGKVIGVDTGSTGDMWTTANRDRYGFAEIRRFEGLAPAMLDLQSRRIDGYISDIPSLQYFVKDKKNFKVIERIETGERYSMMFAKNDPLAAEVDRIIAELKEEGFVAALHEKWFGALPLPTSSTVVVSGRPR